MNPSVTGRIHSIESFGTLDGPGIRYVLFLQGCPLRCLYCHNPDARGESGGTVMSAGEVMADILTYRAFIARGGVTLSGGEPLAQPAFVRDFLSRCAAVGLSVGVETCGFFDWESVEPFIRNIAFFFFDVKCLDDAVHRRVTGQGNERILGNLERLAALCADRITVSVPVVGGVNADTEFFGTLARLCHRLGIGSVRLLPYHTLGVSKYEGLGRAYLMPDSAAVEPEEIGRFAELLRASGIECRID